MPLTIPRGAAVPALRAALAFAAFCLPCVFCYLLRVRALVLQAAWRGVVGSCTFCIPLSFGRHALVLTLALHVKSVNSGQISNHGFFLSPIHITPVHRCVLRLHLHHRIARTGQKCLLATGRGFDRIVEDSVHPVRYRVEYCSPLLGAPPQDTPGRSIGLVRLLK